MSRNPYLPLGEPIDSQPGISPQGPSRASQASARSMSAGEKTEHARSVSPEELPGT